MLRLGPTACRCTSTSTSLPCRHAVTPLRAYSRKTPPNNSAAPLPTYSYLPAIPDGVIMSSKSGHNVTSRTWFDPVQRGWRDWLIHPPTSSSSKPSSYPDPPSTSATMSESEATDLLSAYLTNRGPRSSLAQFSDEYGQLLDIATKDNMPFLKAMVLEDLEYREMSNNERNKLSLERFQKNVKGGKARNEDEIEARGLAELVNTRPVAAEPRTRRRNLKNGEQATIEEPAVDRLNPSDVEPTLAQSLKMLEQFASSTFPASQFSASQLTQVWAQFVQNADLEDSIIDFNLALNFLHRLVASPEPNSALSLNVFESLIHVLPDDLVATQPSVPNIPPDASLRIVLLRTIANAALSEDLYQVAARSLLSLENLHLSLLREHGLEVYRQAEDAEVLYRTVEGLLEDLKAERLTSYNLSKLPSSSRTDQESRLNQLSELVKLLATWPGLEQKTREVLLEQYVEECGQRSRWDLVATVFKHQNAGEKSFELPKYHLKLARWLAGEAPFSTYASGEQHPQPEDFALFARTTHSQLNRTTLGDRWTSDDKFDWIDLLTTSKGATKETRSLARRIVSFWTQNRSLANSRTPFVLRGSTLLNLIRTSLPPYAPSRTHHAEFLRSLLNNLIQALVSPSSPYSNTAPNTPSASPRLDHYDLTTLAQAYGLLRDVDSVAQVYRKLLELRLLPDQKDVAHVLGSVALSQEDAGIGLVRQAKRTGLAIGPEVIKTLIKGIMQSELEASRASSSLRTAAVDQSVEHVVPVWKTKVDSVIKFARTELDFGAAEMRNLEDYVLSFVPLSSAAQLARLPTSRLESILTLARQNRTLSTRVVLGLLSKALDTRNYALATRIYLIAIDPSSSSSSSTLPNSVLTLTLKTLFKAHKASSGSSKLKVLGSLQEVLDLSLEKGTSMITQSQENLELCLQGLVKVGQVDAVEKFWEALEGDFDLRNQVKETVVRWAVGIEGRDRTSSREGIVGVWARERLREKQ
ncbi:uncharacterized protein JCM15063_005443 [Sporobolomyces koalae]|uniref:uncharacterized protein n=1 Tax=Sporobolomyces koalae TaxID=500713 RepID=UPI0031792C82